MKLKYGNRKTEFRGETYDSKKEANYAQELELRKRGKDIKSWERQVKFTIDVLGNHICNYVADFVVTNMDGSKDIIDVKGYRTAVFNLKWKMMDAIYGKKYKLTII